MTSKTSFLAAGALALSLFAAGAAQAQGLRPASFYVQGGVGQDSLSSVTVGASWPWRWKTAAWGGEWSAATEAYASFWRAEAFGGGHQGFTQLAVVPYLRYRFDNGNSPWFAEAGIGLSVTDKLYRTPNKTFSTRFNFTDNIAVGRNFGADMRHEVSLRLQHISNAGIKKPNPGEEFVQLRYAFKY